MNNDNFFSVERLVEFGLGMAVAQQMAQSMNHAMRNVVVPGAQNPIEPIRPSAAYYAVLDGRQAGPFSDSEMMRLISERRIIKNTYLWRAGMTKWEVAENIPDFLRLVALTPPPIPSGS